MPAEYVSAAFKPSQAMCVRRGADHQRAASGARRVPREREREQLGVRPRRTSVRPSDPLEKYVFGRVVSIMDKT